MIFSRGKVRKYPVFKYGNGIINVVHDFVYLGVKFNYNGNFKKAISKQVIQARKASFAMTLKVQRLRLSLDIQCELFDQLILPILLYGCEVWGFEDLSQIEIFHHKFLRAILNVNKYTPDCMIYGETGRTKIDVQVKCRMVGFWLKTSQRKSL